MKSADRFPTTLTKDDYFLSATNPIATADQRDMEAKGLALLEHPAVKASHAMVKRRWETIVGRDITEEGKARLDSFARQFVFNYLMKAVNGDANYPKVLGFAYGSERNWFGRDVPGTRAGGGDGTDQHYSIIPIDYGGRFELECQRMSPACANTPYTLTGSLGMTMTLASLEDPELVIGPDGRYTITLDPDPANGRANHIQTQPNARYLFIRDCRADWRQVPCARRIKRLNPPTMPPLTDDQIARRAVQFMSEDVAAMYWFIRVFAGMEPNVVTAPFGTGAIGGLVTQQISFLRAVLADDEALVLTFGPSDATFRDVVLHDSWFCSLDYGHRTSSMCNAQGRPNADGTTTYVIAIRDPGVYNWLDTTGLHEVLLVHRWQGLPYPLKPGREPTAQGRLVKLAGLDGALPPGMSRVTPEQRRAQLAERVAQFNLRFVDH